MNARVVTIDGIPRLQIDGAAIAGIANLDFPGEFAVEKLLQYSGTPIRTFLVTNSAKPYMFGWEGDDDYRYDGYEGEMRKLLRRRPDARFFLFVGGRPGAPYRWCKAHQDELVLPPDKWPLAAPSLASQLWRRDSAEAIRRFVRHFESSDLAQHIAGYIPIFGTVEWHGVGETDADAPQREHPRSFGDFSRPMREGFRAWLRERYGDDVARLRAAWKQPCLTFDSADVPSIEQRQRLRDGPILPARRRELAGLTDYFAYYNELNASLAELYCRSIKEALPGSAKLTGISHAYLFGWPNETAYPQGSGHVLAQRVLASPHIDFLLAPADPRSLGAGSVRQSQLAIASAHLHGKAVLHLIETHTHHKPPADADAVDADQSCHLMDADFAVALTRGAQAGWMEYHEPVWGHWFPYDQWGPMTYDSPELQQRIAAQLLLAGTGGGEAVADVAVLVSSESCLHRNLERTYGQMFIEDVRRRALPHAGIIYDEYLLEDLPRIRRPYQLYIILDGLLIRPESRTVLRQRLEAGATVLWQYAPGYAADAGWSLESASELIGMRLERDDSPAVFSVELSGGGAMGAGDAPGKGPLFHITAGAEQVLGRFAGSRRIALAGRPVGRGRSVYSAVPLNSPALLRDIARGAGAHVYTDDGDVVLSDGRHLALICAIDGEHTLHLPRPRTVRDAWTEHVVSAGAATFTVSARRGTTRTFSLD